jgi:hypothetical protein
MVEKKSKRKGATMIFKLTLGDWECDGYYANKDYFFESNYSAERITEAYKASCRKMAEKYGVELYEGMCVEAFVRGYVDWNPLVLGDGMSIRFDATNVRIYFYDESSYDRVDGLHVNVNHEELPVFEYAGMPPSEAAKKIWDRIEELVAIWLSTAGWIADTVPLLSPGCTVE